MGRNRGGQREREINRDRGIIGREEGREGGMESHLGTGTPTYALSWYRVIAGN